MLSLYMTHFSLEPHSNAASGGHNMAIKLSNVIIIPPPSLHADNVCMVDQKMQRILNEVANVDMVAMAC